MGNYLRPVLYLMESSGSSKMEGGIKLKTRNMGQAVENSQSYKPFLQHLWVWLPNTSGNYFLTPKISGAGGLDTSFMGWSTCFGGIWQQNKTFWEHQSEKDVSIKKKSQRQTALLALEMEAQHMSKVMDTFEKLERLRKKNSPLRARAIAQQ